MRFLLAFACFFRLLFTGRLPAKAAAYLPAEVKAELTAPEAAIPLITKEIRDVVAAEVEKPAVKATMTTTAASALADHHREGALALLALLQREGRLIDFLRESLADYSDAEIGVAVRDIHRGCTKVIDDHFVLEAVMPGVEDDAVRVPAGFDPGEVRLIGELKGEPPFAGVLRHHGWRVTEVKFPTLTDGVDRRVVAPAEVEVSP